MLVYGGIYKGDMLEYIYILIHKGDHVDKFCHDLRPHVATSLKMMLCRKRGIILSNHPEQP
jgi:hypothetical protein